MGHIDELVGRVPPGRDHRDHGMPRFAGFDYPVGDALHAGGVRHRCPPELHHDDVRTLGFALWSAEHDVLGTKRVLGHGWLAALGLRFVRHLDQCSTWVVLRERSILSDFSERD